MTDESKLILTITDRQAFRNWLGQYGTESGGV